MSSTDYNTLGKGLIRLAILLLLFIATPIIITMTFKALNNFTESPEVYLAYALVLISLALLIFTLLFAFKTFKMLLDAFFTNS